jgi:hypothetical protein
MFRTRSTTAVLAAILGIVTMLITVGPSAEAQPISGASDAGQITAGLEATSGEAVWEPMTLPHKTIRHPNGVIEQIATPEAIAALMKETRASKVSASSTSATAQTVYGCGYYCDNKDPNSYKWGGSTCSGTTVNTVSYGNYYAELRYSSRCASAWTRTAPGVGGAGFGYNENGSLRIQVVSPWGRTSGSPVWTSMVYDGYPLKFRACLDTILAGSGNSWLCTLKY